MTEYSLKNLQNEIANKASSLSLPYAKSWLINSVLKDHQDIEGDDKYIAILCMRETITTCVEVFIRKFKKQSDKSESKQLVLPGFTHLQRQYVFLRDGESIIDSIDNMSYEECLNKRLELENMRDGLNIHIDEWSRYIESRFGSVGKGVL